MSSREEQKAAARQARLDREEAEAARGRRTRRLRILAAVAALAFVAVVAAIVVSGSSEPDAGDGGPVAGTAEVRALLAGIPQDGTVLGRRDAPATVVELVDPQCPFCADAATRALPPVIMREVRRGELRLDLQTLTFLGPDSVRLGVLFAGAALQDRLWQVAELAFRNQGRENSGYATDDYLRRVGRAAGVDVDRALREGASARGRAILARARRLADRYRVEATPTFVAGRTGGPLRPVELSDLDAAALRTAVQRAAQ